MKRVDIFIATIFLRLSFTKAFVMYPLDAKSALTEFLISISADKLSLSHGYMKHAVPGEECFRPCLENQPKVCHFEFRLEHYQVFGG